MSKMTPQTPFTPHDILMMSRAIALAKRGLYTTAPNPNVGCVISRNGTIVGEGFHFKAGEPHAEVYALRQAKQQAQGATAYVTLEPCSHFGRTPPCANALIEAKVSKVICAMSDPNPQVAGRGFAMLREAGIEVQVGLLESQANALNRAFIKRMKTNKPFVQLKMAASLDGQTALSNGDSQWITSTPARKDVQRYRAQAGAILSTSQTVLADNASLTVRPHELPDSIQQQINQRPFSASDTVRQPLRVILDRQHQLSSASVKRELKLFQSQGKVITVAQDRADVHVPCDDSSRLDLAHTLEKIATEHNVNHIWVEAGATLAASLIQQQLVDELIVYLAPKLMGGDGASVLGALGLNSMSDVIDLQITDVRQVGQDIRFCANVIYPQPKIKE